MLGRLARVDVRVIGLFTRRMVVDGTFGTKGLGHRSTPDRLQGGGMRSRMTGTGHISPDAISVPMQIDPLRPASPTTAVRRATRRL
jgi:hypothetical protein